MSLDRVIEILLGLITCIVAYATFRLSTRTMQSENRASIKAVDAQAYQRAREIYEGAMDTLKDELAETRKDLASARSELDSARNEIIALRRDIARLEGEIRIMRQQQNRDEKSIQALKERQDNDSGGGV